MKFSKFFEAVISALGHGHFLWTNDDGKTTSACLDIIHDGYSLAMTDALDNDKPGSSVDVWPSHIASTANKFKLAESA